MARFRIIEIMHSATSDNTDDRFRSVYIIEKKDLFGWSEIYHKEVRTKRIEHKSYAEAETYMRKNYLGDNGILTINGNEYRFVQYSYAV